MSKDSDLAICQMDVLNRVLKDGGIDISTAIRELQLDKPKYMRLADREGLPWVAEEIEKVLKEAYRTPTGGTDQ